MSAKRIRVNGKLCKPSGRVRLKIAQEQDRKAAEVVRAKAARGTMNPLPVGQQKLIAPVIEDPENPEPAWKRKWRRKAQKALYNRYGLRKWS